MAYVTGFEHDVFISFTHDDNQLVIGPDGWITLFERVLTGLLRQRLPEKREIKVFRDPQLSSNDLLGNTLDSVVAQSAVLACVMSPRYLKADWCRRELSTFWQSRRQGFEPKLGGRLRAFKVLIQDAETIRAIEESLGENYPPEMRETLGQSFFESSPLSKEFTQWAWPRGLEDRDQRFSVQMERLANDIASTLESMRRVVDRRVGKLRDDFPAPVVPPHKILCTAYLADVTDDLEDDRYKLKQEMERQGVRVLPEDSLPNRRDEAEKEIRRCLVESQFAVHLFSENYGRKLRGDEEQCSLPHLQYLLSREHATSVKTKFERFAWIPDTIVRNLLAPAQLDLLKELENEEDKDARIDIQTGSMQRLKESILMRVRKPIRPAAPNSKRRLIYVTGQPSDTNSKDTTTLIGFLKKEHDVNVSPTTDEDQPRQKARHERNCQMSDGLVLLYGVAEPDWVQDQALDIRALSERRREKPLAAAVYQGPPADREELPIYFENVLVVDGRKGFDPQKLEGFLERLAQSNEPSVVS